MDVTALASTQQEFRDNVQDGHYGRNRLSRNTLTIISPFLNEKAFGTFLEEVLRALWRGVRVTVMTHAADDVASEQSKALEHLRRESEALPGSLTVYTTEDHSAFLLHAKIVVADDTRVIIGSANITKPGLEAHFEAGVILGESEAVETKRIIVDLLRSNLVKRVFHTGLSTDLVAGKPAFCPL